MVALPYPIRPPRQLPKRLASDGNRRLDGRVRLVILQFEILILEVENIADSGIEDHAGQRKRRARKLFLRLLQMIQVKMGVAQRVDEFAGLQAGDLRQHRVSSAYEAMLKGTPRKISAERW